MERPIFDVSGAVAVLNQTLEYAFTNMVIMGEVSEFRVSKGKWVYFDIKDESSKLKCFATVYQLNMPLEDGMQVELVAQPRLHNLYGFSLTVQHIRPVGEGSIKKASDLLQAMLTKEGLFAPERKRPVPYPPASIALITSSESAAYADFVKILQARWPYVDVYLYDVQVQGAQAEEDIVRALQTCNAKSVQDDVIVIVRGGGSADDLQVFSTETVTRAVAASRIPTVVAIGHEVDISLAELAADLRASTPSNAAELLAPNREEVRATIRTKKSFLERVVLEELRSRAENLNRSRELLENALTLYFKDARAGLHHAELRIESYHPKQILRRGYGIVRIDGTLLPKGKRPKAGNQLQVELEAYTLEATITKVEDTSHEKNL